MKHLGSDVYETGGTELVSLLSVDKLSAIKRQMLAECDVIPLPMPHAAMDLLIERALADYPRQAAYEMIADAVRHGLGVSLDGQFIPFADYRPHADRPLHDPEDDCA